MRALDSDVAVPKYQQITESLREQIRQGRWRSGERLPACREFADHFRVTPMTVWKAFDELTRERLIVRIQGKGTYVAEPIAAATATDLVGVIMQTEGDTYGRIHTQLLRQLGAADRHVVSTDIGGYDHTPEQRHQALSRFLARGTAELVVDGRTFLPFPLLREWHQSHRQLTFVLRCETTLDFAGANHVLSDWEAGGRLVAEHLVGLGRGKLLVVSHAYPGATYPTLGPEYQFHWAMLRGLRRVLEAAGLAPEEHLRLVLDVPQVEVEGELRKALRDGFRGVFCLGDFRAPKVYRAAAAEGLEIGKDVAVCGYFDTPWAAALHPTLTSVNIQEDLLAATAAEAVLNEWRGERVLVPPVLRPRESTRPGDRDHE